MKKNAEFFAGIVPRYISTMIIVATIRCAVLSVAILVFQNTAGKEQAYSQIVNSFWVALFTYGLLELSCIADEILQIRKFKR